MHRYVVFGQKGEPSPIIPAYEWEFIGIFSAENIDHAVEQAKNAEPEKTKFFAGIGLFRGVDFDGR